MGPMKSSPRRSRKISRAASGSGAKRLRTARAKNPKARLQHTEAALAALAHEIRTPLTGILALSELIAASDLPERERRWAQAVKSAAEHLAQLTTLVVDGVRADARGLVLQEGPFAPRALADAVAAALTARAARREPPNQSRRRDAVETGQGDVHEDDVVGAPPECFHRRLAGADEVGTMAELGEDGVQHHAAVWVVLGAQDAQAPGRRRGA